ncbi:hypothetical protein F5Y15DRAFT_45284 [Xylariaceae sp. FL0016]|nr:hypothetical protein F5Y15DRAFT_45284 [Xylariaceae sp. FL0016]
MDIDAALLYGAGLTACIVFFTFRRIALVIAERGRTHFRRYLLYPLVIVRRRHTSSVTRLDLLFLMSFLGANGILLGWPSKDDISKRAALASLINLVPLSFGGKTNPLMSFVGLPLSKYYFAHHWLGRVAFVEAFIHLFVSLRRLQSFSINGISASGYTTAFGLLCITLWSLCFIRRFRYDLFTKMHTFLSMLVLGALLWHIFLVDQVFSKVVIVSACGLWLVTTLFRFLRALHRGVATTDIWKDGQIVRAQIRVRRPIKIYPGSYFYLYFPAAPFRLKIKGHPMNLAWWDVADFQGSGYSSDLVFLMYRQGTLSALTRREGSFQRVILDGPYGQDLRLHDYENVMLVAKGPGIAGVLPHALHLAGRRMHDMKYDIDEQRERSARFRDKTRKVDLFWVLEDNSQQKWLREEFRSLQKLDPRNVLLCIWCIFPSPKRRDPPFKANRYWRCFYPRPDSDFYQNGVIKELSASEDSPGRSIVVCCGEPSFTGQVRGEVVRKALMEFVEVEYRPSFSTEDFKVADTLPKRIKKRWGRHNVGEGIEMA